jgi:hypothetical protein
MTHPRAVVRSRAQAPLAPRSVTDIAARTTGHIAYLEPLRAGEPIVLHGDTLPALRIWKYPFR